MRLPVPKTCNEFFNICPVCVLATAPRSLKLGIVGVTLHSCRYAWAERAKTCGMPERFAQEALGHNSKAVHRAYAKRALMKIPSLEDYETQAALKTSPPLR